jgi:DNA polymerase delta subunit 2
VLFGVLFKDMALKPSVLSDIQENLNLSEAFMIPKGCSDISKRLSETDTVYLEDMEARLQLVFPSSRGEDLKKLVTGITIAILGHATEQGHFEVTDFVLPGYPSISHMDTSKSESPVYVGIVSGLQVGSPDSNPVSLNLLRDFIMGASGSTSDRDLASRMVRLVIAGDSLYYNQLKDPSGSSLAEADMFFSELSSVIPVDVMTGARDPSNYCLPQEPLHSGLFPNARRYANLTVHTNPYKFKMGQVVFLGTSGQNVTDFLQYSSIEDPLESLEVIANSRHLAPTAPDTLACYPFTTVDPLMVDDEAGSVARIIFAGNQSVTKSRMMNSENDDEVVVASVADFAVNPSLLLVNINDIRDIRVVAFETPKHI